MSQSTEELLASMQKQLAILKQGVNELQGERDGFEIRFGQLRDLLADALEGTGRFAQAHAVVDGRRCIYWNTLLDAVRALEPEKEEATP